MPNHLCGNQTPSSEGHPEFDFPHRVARQNTCISRAGRPAVVAPRIHVVAVDAAAQRFQIVEEELVRARDFSLIEHASEDHKAALVEVCASRGAVRDVELVHVDEARRFGGCGRNFGAKGSARLRRHARRESYACQRDSHSIVSTSRASQCESSAISSALL